MLLRVILFISFMLVPSAALAWGPLTHVYLGSEIYYLGSLLPAALYELLRKYRQDYLYGNIMADTILAKKYLSREKDGHSWEVAMEMVQTAEEDHEKAFCMGYLSHLAADTVAHGRFTKGQRNLGHTFLELKADSAIDRSYWFRALSIERAVQTRNDAFLEQYLHRVVFSFKTNKRIFKSMVALSGFNQPGLGTLFEKSFPGAARWKELPSLREESLDRILDVLVNGERSEVLKKDPSGRLKGIKFIKAFLG